MDSGETAPFGPFGPQSSSDGARFLNPHGEAGVRIFDGDGATLFEAERGGDLVSWAGFDATGQRAVLQVEMGPAWVIDLESGEKTPIHLGLVSSLAMSPCGLYLLVSGFHLLTVIRVSDHAAVRHLPVRPRMVTAVAWSPDGQQVATSTCDSNGYHSDVTLHRVGRAIDATYAAALPVPAPAELDITDLAALYLAQTRRFGRGWQSHLDDDRMDFHLALKRMGYEMDLVPHIEAVRDQVAARAYEAVIWHRRGEDERARAALADASARLKGNEPDRYGFTFIYAPLAAAQHVLGHAEAAHASWELAQRRLDEESNRFQKRAIIGRALLMMGRIDEVGALIEPAASSHTFGGFHLRLLLEMLHHGEWALFRRAFTAWRVPEAWSSKSDLEQALRLRGLPGPDAPPDFRAWLGAHVRPSAPPANDPGEQPPTAVDARLPWLAARGRWEDVYALIGEGKPTQRGALSRVAASGALERRELHVLFDLLPRIPCGDMNAPGLRMLQRSFRELAGSAYRQNHV